MRRMSISPVFGYTYLVIHSLSAIPGMLLLAPGTDGGCHATRSGSQLIGWLYDFAFLSFCPGPWGYSLSAHWSGCSPS